MPRKSFFAVSFLALISVCGPELALAAMENESGPSENLAATTVSVARLTASDGVAGVDLGAAVAMSGNTVVVAENCSVGCTTDYAGAVYVYQTQGAWEDMTQTAELKPSDGYVDDGFGQSVAIAGNTIVVGSFGKAYVFVNAGDTWTNMTETAQLSDGATGDYFGIAVAISRGTIVVGASSGGNQAHGAAYVFVEPRSGWRTTSVPNAELIASDGTTQSLFGVSVAINGTTIVVGSPFHQDQTGPGEVYVFTKPNAGWAPTTQTAILTRSPQGPYDEFGFSVAISNNTIAVGAPQAVGVNNGQGTVDIFEKPVQGWVNATQNAELVSPSFIQHFGFSVGLVGRVLVVGTFDPKNLIFVFLEPKTGWKSSSKPQAQLTAGDGIAFFGFSVATSGSAVVGGAPWETVNGNSSQGAAYVFTK
jgi:hypothetical protein